MDQHQIVRTLATTLAVSLFALSGCQTATQNIRSAPTPHQTSVGSPLTVMSFNILMGAGQDASGDPFHMNWGKNLDAVIDTIRSVDPDIVGLQEVANLNQTRKIAKSLDLNYAFIAHDPGRQRSEWWGNAILSKFPILESQSFRLDSPINDRFVVQAKVEFDGRQILALSIHKDPRVNDGRAITMIMDAIEGLDLPVVLIGDFNMTPNDERLNRLRERFVDTATAVDTPSAKEARVRGTLAKGFRRIDYIFAASDHFDVVDAGLVREKYRSSSDHLAYFSVLRLRR